MLQRPHIVQTIRQFYQNDADIPGHGKKHLSQIFRLPLQFFRILILICVLPVKIQLIQLRDAIHQKSYILTELLPDLLVRHNGVFHHIV